MNIEERLFSLQDTKYRDFHRGLVPGMKDDYIIGVRMPMLRQLAKEIEPEPFLRQLPHKYYEENQLHAILINRMKDFDECLIYVDLFLYHVNNWATCDTLRPRCFAKHLDKLQIHVERWMLESHEYAVRFGIGMLESFYLDEAFRKEHLEWVTRVNRPEYYVRMMQAWYFATALAKQWEATLPVVEKLPQWVRHKAIQKACESYRVSEEHKAILRTMKH